MFFISSIAPTFLLATLIVPLVNGFRKGKWSTSAMMSWVLFVTSTLFYDAFSPLLADQFFGYAAAQSISSDQPGTGAAICIGWSVGLIIHPIGFVLRRAVDFSRRLIRSNAGSTQT